MIINLLAFRRGKRDKDRVEKRTDRREEEGEGMRAGGGIKECQGE